MKAAELRSVPPTGPRARLENRLPQLNVAALPRTFCSARIASGRQESAGTLAADARLLESSPLANPPALTVVLFGRVSRGESELHIFTSATQSDVSMRASPPRSG